MLLYILLLYPASNVVNFIAFAGFPISRWFLNFFTVNVLGCSRLYAQVTYTVEQILSEFPDGIVLANEREENIIADLLHLTVAIHTEMAV